MFDFLVSLLLLGVMLWIIWQLFVIVGDMAERRGQDRLLWQIAALFINPVAAMALLWLFVQVKFPDA